MITVYAFATPNSVRVPIMLEEIGLPYTLVSVNVRKGEQKAPPFLALNPNGRVPVLTDPEGPDGRPITVTESAAILIYLAEKTDRLLPTVGEIRLRTFEQLLFQVTAIGPAFGQAGHFRKQAPEQIPYALERFGAEAARAMRVFDGLLATRRFAAGDEYTIADIAHHGWLWRRAFADVDLTSSPNVQRWFDEVDMRPAVRRGVARVKALLPTT